VRTIAELDHYYEVGLLNQAPYITVVPDDGVVGAQCVDASEVRAYTERLRS
jgi:hypothetical protein